jgi:biopolymer transport protein ExbD
MSEAVQGGKVRAEPNLVPILDMVFQLITFFMMVVNFKNAALDLNLKLPIVGSARPVESGSSGTDFVILNIARDAERKEYCLRVYKQSIENVEGYIAAEAQASLMANHMTQADLDEGKDLPTRVVIRADQATPFKALNRVIVACQQNGYRNFALKTDMRAKVGKEDDKE